jgi:hypothetical protein
MVDKGANDTIQGERDAKGRFRPGNRSTGGRPPGVGKYDRVKIMSGLVDAKAWREICVKAIADAKAGCRHAREWLARYMLPPADEPLPHEAMPAMSPDEELDAALADAPYIARGALLETLQRIANGEN